MIDLRNVIESHVSVTGLVHVGAHEGQELGYYNTLPNVHLIEPIPYLVELLKTKTHHAVYEFAAWDEETELTFFITEFDQGSSVLRPLEHVINESITVEAIPLRNVLSDSVNVAVVDTQGSELRVLRGMNLVPLSLIIVETSSRVRYAEGATGEEITDFLVKNGFRLVDSYSHSNDGVITDMVFVK